MESRHRYMGIMRLVMALVCLVGVHVQAAYPPYVSFDNGQFYTSATLGELGLQPLITNAAGANITFDMSYGAAPYLITTNSSNQTITLANVTGNTREKQWVVRVIGDGTHTLTFAGEPITFPPESNPFLSPPPSGVNEYLFDNVKGTLFCYVMRPGYTQTHVLSGRDTTGAGDIEEVPIWTALGWISTARGSMLYKASAAWTNLVVGSSGQILTSNGTDPAWASVSSAIDTALGSTQGNILYRGASGWTVLAPGTSGNVLQTGGAGGNPSWTASAASPVQYATGTLVTISNTTTETTILTNTLTAGILGTNKTIRINCFGDILSNHSSTDLFTIKLYLGSTTMFSQAPAQPSTSAQRFSTRISCTIANKDSASAQLANFLYNRSTAGANQLTSAGASAMVDATATENSANALGLGITITPNAASTTFVWDAKYANVVLE